MTGCAKSIGSIFLPPLPLTPFILPLLLFFPHKNMLNNVFVLFCFHPRVVGPGECELSSQFRSPSFTGIGIDVKRFPRIQLSVRSQSGRFFGAVRLVLRLVLPSWRRLGKIPTGYYSTCIPFPALPSLRANGVSGANPPACLCIYVCVFLWDCGFVPSYAKPNT